MLFDAATLERLTKENSTESWRIIIQKALGVAQEPLDGIEPVKEILSRDREIGKLDTFLSTAGWDLWRDFPKVVERNSTRLVRWWSEPYAAKAVLILDGLSLRELPWITYGAKGRGFSVHEVGAYASELPGETNQFAQALGFSSRSQLQNNGAGASHYLHPAFTESGDLPWEDCAKLIDHSPNTVFWHHWPDSKIHDGSGAGQGLETLTHDVINKLTSDAFWGFVERLATGRRLVITSDHGYAATGHFADAEGDVAQYLKSTFASGRSAAGSRALSPYLPPVALEVHGSHGHYVMALGRRKWKSQGGYPTLTHGGLSVLEVLSPFVEITK
jgi:hypothetical protein